MLSRPSFSNDPPLPHFLSKESLAESIVDLVRATMQEILSLQVDFSPSNVASQIGSKVQWRRSAGETVQPARQLFLQALTSSLTFPSMSDDFIIEVPTRKAPAPAALSRLISREDSIPLSETTGLSTSTFSARIFSVVERSNWKVDRLRLLIP